MVLLPSRIRTLECSNGVQVVTVNGEPGRRRVLSVVITPSDQDSLSEWSPDYSERLAAKTDITVDVTAEDGITTDTYSVTIYRERLDTSDDADLSALRSEWCGGASRRRSTLTRLNYIGSGDRQH